MKTSKLITTCIPLYNGEHYLAEAIESVIGQHYSPNILLISNDGSKDSSLDIVQKFLNVSKDILLVSNPKPNGMAANWNRCAEQVETPYFTLLHQDDRQSASFLSKAVEFLEKNPSVGMVFCDFDIINSAGQVVQDKKAGIKRKLLGNALLENEYIFKSPELAPILLRGNVFCCPAAVFRKEAFDRLGPFSTDFHFVQDWEYWIRACIHQVDIGYLNASHFQYRVHGANATEGLKKDFRKYSERKQILDFAFRSFSEKGWVKKEDDQIVNSSIFNVMLWDLAEELAFGSPESFKGHLAYALNEIEGFRSYVPAKIFCKLSSGGPMVGKMALKSGKFLSNLWMK